MERRPPDPGILVDRQIRDALTGGWLSIEPFDDDALEPATYDLRVGDIAVVSTLPQPVNLREQNLLTIEPFAAALLHTDEILALSPQIAGRLGPRSNLLRQGIFVSTGPQIDPGFQGRLFVNLLNVTDRPFLIRHHAKFLTIEFHALVMAPLKPYAGPHQGRTEFTDEQVNAILGRGGASLKGVHRALLEVQGPLKDAAILGREVPRLYDVQESMLAQLSTLSGQLAESRLAVPRSILVTITSLGDGPYELMRDLPIVVQSIDGAFTATFFDGNVSASGDTQEEAVANLKTYLVELLQDLESESPGRLGPEPSRQLNALRGVTRKRR